MPLGTFRQSLYLANLSGGTSVVTRTPKNVTVWDNSGDLQSAAIGKIDKSIYFPGGVSTGYLEVPMSSEFQWHTQSYTMEAWVYPTTFTIHGNDDTAAIIGNSGYDGWGYYNFGFNNQGKIIFHYYYNNSTSNVAVVKESTTSGVINRWQHIAMTHSSGTIKLYVNGVEKVSASVVGTPGYNFGNQRNFQIGNYVNSFKGFMDEIRVSNTVRYPSNFTPSTSAFTNDENTILLIHGEDTTPYISGTVCVSDDGGEENIAKLGYYGYAFNANETNASAINPKQLAIVGHSSNNKIRSIYMSQNSGDLTNYVTPLIFDSSTKTFTKGTRLATDATTSNAFWGRKVVSENSYKTNSINETAYAMSYVPQVAAGNRVFPMTIDSDGVITLGTAAVTTVTSIGTVAEHADIDFDNINSESNPTYVWWGRDDAGNNTAMAFTRSGNSLTRIAGNNAYSTGNRATTTRSGSTIGRANMLQISGNGGTLTATTIGTSNVYTGTGQGSGFIAGKVKAILLSSTSNTSRYILYSRNTANTHWAAKIVDATWSNSTAPALTISDLFIEDEIANHPDISGYESILVKGWETNTFLLFYVNNNSLFVRNAIVAGNEIVWGRTQVLGPVNPDSFGVQSFDIQSSFVDTSNRYLIGLSSSSGFENSIGDLSHFAIDASNYTLPTTGYSVAPVVTSIDETVFYQYLFRVSTAGVANGTTLYIKYYVNGVEQTSVPSEDIDGSDSVSINNNQAFITGTALPDQTTEGPQKLYVELYTDSGKTNKVATSLPITIQDTSIAVPNLTFITSTESSSSTIVIPATAAIGDIAILADRSTTNSQVVPSGWTLHMGAGTTGLRTTASFKILTAGDIGATITGQGGTTNKRLLIYRPAIPISSAIGTVVGQQATTATPSSRTMPLTTVPKPSLCYAVYSSTASTPTRGWSAGSPIESGTGLLWTKHQAVNVDSINSNNASISQSDGGTNVLLVGYIRLT